MTMIIIDSMKDNLTKQKTYNLHYIDKKEIKCKLSRFYNRP